MTTDPELAALRRMYEQGEITAEKYRQKRAAYTRDVEAEQDRRDIIAAGRGHLVR